MKLSIISNLFNGNQSLKNFKDLIKYEINLYQKALDKKGSSVPISLIDDCELFFRTKDLAFMCNAFIQNNLNYIELAYIADAVLLSNNVTFEKEWLEEKLEWFTITWDEDKLKYEEVESLLREIGEYEG